MSGHSKWHNIRRAKEKTDAVRGKIFTKIGREIAVAVKLGGADPSTNTKLFDCIQKAKANNIPADNITRSIKKASGEQSDVNYESAVYEGYGIGGSAVIVVTLSDNKNRTAGDVRHLFDKYGGSLGTLNSVSYNFEKKGIITVEKGNFSEDNLMEIGIELNAQDVITYEDCYEIVASPADLLAVTKGLTEKNITVLESSVKLVSGNLIDLDDDKMEKFIKMIDLLEELDDVQEVYHNVNI